MKTNAKSLKGGGDDQGERDSTEIYIRIDTNMKNSDDVDEEKESESNKRLYYT